MELFDKRFVYLEWDDKLEGKKVVIADTLGELKKKLHSELFVSVIENKGDYPFTPSEDDTNITIMNFAMAYYDPNYECKKAHAQGKMIQCKLKDSPFLWEDCTNEPKWLDTSEYRVKPGQEKRRMTNREIAKWIMQGNGQVKRRDGNYALAAYNAYDIRDDNKPCPDYIVVRGWDETEWHEPEVEE